MPLAPGNNIAGVNIIFDGVNFTSFTDNPLMVVFPVLVTVNVYSIVSPAFNPAGNELSRYCAVFTNAIDGETSVIVPVPLALVLVVLPEVIVPVKVKFSFPSTNASVFAGTVTVALVCPAGIVTVVNDGTP